MTAKFWRICLVVALSVVVTRPSATIRTGSPDSGWWSSSAAKQLISSAGDEIRNGHYGAAENLFSRAAMESRRRGDRIATARLLSGVGGARMARFDYRGALDAYVEAQGIAEKAGDWFDLGAIDLNLSNVYEQVWDLGAAVRAAEEGRLAEAKTPGAYYKSELLMQIGRLHEERGDADPIPFFTEAVEAAREFLSKAPEADAWSLLGKKCLSQGDFDAAEDAFLRAFYLRELFAAGHRFIGNSYMDFGAVQLARAEAAPDGPHKSKLLDEAAQFTARAQEQVQRGAVSIIPFELAQQRGRILLLQGDVPGALQELSSAVESAERWRGGMATAELQEQTFAKFIDSAAAYGLTTRDKKWISASFLADEALRASNLRDNAGLIDIWRRKLAPEFWATLAQLRAAQSGLRSAGLSQSAEVDSLQLRLIAMEAEAGLGIISENKPENFLGERALNHYRSVLSDSAVLLSFKLGDAGSYVWALTRGSLSVYRLPAREKIAMLVRDFRSAIREERPESNDLAKELYAMLFGQLKPEEAGKRDWLISPADALLQLPFAALLVDASHYLVELHSIQIVEGKPRPLKSSPGAEAKFLGVGDPIYNVADPRWKEGGGWFFQLTNAGGNGLNRLAGSGREVEGSAKYWSNRTILEGTIARKDAFLKHLNPVPDVIHLATHVLASETGTNEAFVAFSIGIDGQPELLGTTEVAMLQIPGTLVVLTGCDSAGGDLRGAAGMENLTRAWIIAGASAVVATEWPVRDSGGRLLENFYAQLRHAPPVEALRQAQIASLHSGAAASNPVEWASYQLYGGVQ